MMNSRCCPLCGGSNIREKYANAPLPIWHCICGAVFLSPFSVPEDLKDMYRESYYESWGLAADNEEGPRQMKHLTFEARLKRISHRLEPGKVLDVGCATGYFLEVAAEAGWDVHGVELSEYSARLAQKKFGDRVFNGTLEEAYYADETFDLITLSDLLEHVQKPAAFLREVRRILKPTGLLMIVTPNAASLSCRLMGVNWSHYKAEHLHYFSPRTIKQLLTDSGFTLLVVEGAAKYLNFAYIINQFRIYNHPLLTTLLNGVGRLLPDSLKAANFPVLCGELLALAVKE